MRILGIDPGTATTGFGVIQIERNHSRLLDYGHISTGKTDSRSNRLHQIAQDLTTLCTQWKPSVCAVEELFFSKNVKTAMQVAEARGVILQTLTACGYPVVEYNPGQIKMAITGYGKATKPQMQKMVSLILKLKEIPKPDDAADALAIALCHAQNIAFKKAIFTS